MLTEISASLGALVPVHHGPTARKRARAAIDEHVLHHPALGPLPIDATFRWSGVAGRSDQRHLHGFLFLADWQTTVLPEDTSAVTACAEMFRQWGRHHPVPLAPEDVDTASMSFHDETTAQRSLQLSLFLTRAWTVLDAPARQQLAGLARDHVTLLAQAWFHAGNNNHGMFQDFALLNLTMVGELTGELSAEEIRAHADLAVGRLVAYFTSSFTSDGVHTENSPGYHLMAARSLRDALPIIERISPEHAALLQQIYESAQRYATHSIMPNGLMPPLSDTKQFKVWASNHSDTFTGGNFRSSMTGGRYGTKPTERVGIFPDAGYAIYRARWANPDATWILFKAGYKANYHHHCDDLSILYYRDGDLILSEAGPYGYDHKDPLTTYAFSQWAHNNIVIDGKSLPRVDRAPNGVSFEELSEEESSTTPVMAVRGTNSRSARWSHQRSLAVFEDWRVRPQRSITEVRDRVSTQDDANHDFTCLWHAGPSVTVKIVDGTSAQFIRGGKPALTLSWESSLEVSVDVVTGVAGDEPRAMRFPAFGQSVQGRTLSITARGKQWDLTTRIV